MLVLEGVFLLKLITAINGRSPGDFFFGLFVLAREDARLCHNVARSTGRFQVPFQDGYVYAVKDQLLGSWWLCGIQRKPHETQFCRRRDVSDVSVLSVFWISKRWWLFWPTVAPRNEDGLISADEVEVFFLAGFLHGTLGGKYTMKVFEKCLGWRFNT